MTYLNTNHHQVKSNPIDLIEQIVIANQWPFERLGTNEMAFSFKGTQTHYHLWLDWKADMRVLELSCTIDISISKQKYSEMTDAITRINHELLIGHFDTGPDQSAIIYRNTLLAGGLQAYELEMMVDIALSTCERCYPAFMLLLWGGYNPEEAVAAAMFETVGEA